MQVSSDSCDSETTVTSHPSQDVTTPVPTEQPTVFDLPDAAVADGKSSSMEDNRHDGSSQEVPQYTAHQLPTRPEEAERKETLPEECVEREDRTISEPEPTGSCSISASEHMQQHVQNQPETAPPTEDVGAEGEACGACVNGSVSLWPTPSSSPVLEALNRAKELQIIRAGQGGGPPRDEGPKSPDRARERRLATMRRSSSLPTSLLSPSRVVSSVRIQIGRGQASCALPRYSFKYTQEDGGSSEEEEEEGQTNCQSTLVINPASSSLFSKKPTRPPTDAPIPPKPIPPYLLDSSCSSHTSTPPPDWSPAGRDHTWSSVPDLSSNQHQPGDFQQNISSNHNQQTLNPVQAMPSYPAAPYLNLRRNPSPGFTSNPYPFTLHPPPQYPSRLQPYGSLPNLHLHHSPSRNHHSSLTSLHQPTAPAVPQHRPPGTTTPHYVPSGSPHPGSPLLHHQSYSYPHSHQLPYHVTPHDSPYLGFHGYSVYPHPAYPQPLTHCPPLVPEHGLHPALTPPAPGFFPALGQVHGLLPGLAPPAPPGPGPNQGPSSTEMQLRKVLHDIRGTVHSLNQVSRLQSGSFVCNDMFGLSFVFTSRSPFLKFLSSSSRTELTLPTGSVSTEHLFPASR